jgi:RimJ/RimL family protein N-acetyltransferase
VEALRFEAYDWDATPEPVLETLVEQMLALDVEMGQDDPLRTPDEVRAFLHAGWGHPWRQRHVLALEGEAAVGFGEWAVDPVNNPTNAWIQVYVRPERRRHGIGGRLAGAVLDDMAGRHPVATAGFCLQPNRPVGGELRALVEGRWGLQPRTIERKGRLDFASLDAADIRAQLDARWRKVGDRFRLLFFELDAFPAAETGFDVDSYLAAMNEIEALMPMEDLELEPERMDLERIQSVSGLQRQRGRTIWNLVAVDQPEGYCAGYTAVSFNPAEPAVIQQWGTGVVRRAQGHGLGKLLKLAMLDKLLAEVPGAHHIHTSNAGSNAAMIGINTDLGFYEDFRLHCYQLPADELRRLLGAGA